MDVAVSCFLPELYPPGLLWFIASGTVEEPGELRDAFFLLCVSLFLCFTRVLFPASLPSHSGSHGDLGKLNDDPIIVVALLLFDFRLHDRYRKVLGMSCLALLLRSGGVIGQDTVWCRRRPIL